MSKIIKPVFNDVVEMIGGLIKKDKRKKKKLTYAPSKYSKLSDIKPLPIRRHAVLPPAVPLVVPPLLPAPPRGLIEYFTGFVPGSRKPASKVSSSKLATKAPRKRRRTKAEMLLEKAREAEIAEAKKAPKKAAKKEEAKEEELPFVLPDLLLPEGFIESPKPSPKKERAKAKVASITRGTIPPPPLESPPKNPVGRPRKIPPPPPSPELGVKKYLPLTKESAAAAAFRELPTGFGKFKKNKKK